MLFEYSSFLCDIFSKPLCFFLRKILVLKWAFLKLHNTFLLNFKQFQSFFSVTTMYWASSSAIKLFVIVSLHGYKQC